MLEERQGKKKNVKQYHVARISKTSNVENSIGQMTWFLSNINRKMKKRGKGAIIVKKKK